MDFSWTEEQLAYRQKVADFARRELNDGLIERDQAGEFSMENWVRCAGFGIQGLSVPAAYNGSTDTDFLTAMLAMEGMGYGCRDNGLNFALNAQMWTVQLPIVQFGTKAQKKKYLPPMCAGKMVGVHAITEPDAGSDVYSLKTTAEKTDGGYILNGHKHLITLGPIADVALVFATIDPSQGKWGVTAFLVESSNPGFDAGPMQHKMGLRTVPIGEIRLKNCFVPDDARLGAEGAGIGLSTSFLEWERCCILASQLGTMQRQLDETIAEAKARKQFGQSIGKFQSVANKIVDMKLRLETSRLLLHKVAWLKMTGQPAMAEAALLKLHLSECFVESSLDAIQIHGGRGYLSESGVERNLRDAIGGRIYAGTSEIQRNIVARFLGL